MWDVAQYHSGKWSESCQILGEDLAAKDNELSAHEKLCVGSREGLSQVILKKIHARLVNGQMIYGNSILDSSMVYPVDGLVAVA